MRVYNIVQSVKGGCGKTTFSIMLSGFLGKEEYIKKIGATCLIDADFQGTSLINLFTHDKSSSKMVLDQCYLNEKMRKYDTSYNYVRKYDKSGRTFYYVPSSPEYDQKEWFYANARMNYVPHMAYNIFEINLKSMLKDKGNGLTQEIDGNLTNIIFDMPPSCDGYSDIIKKCIVNENEGIRKTDDIVNYYLMINLDPTHLYSTIEYLKQILRSTDQLPTHIFIVFNDNHFIEDEENTHALFEERKKQIEAILYKENVSEEYIKKIIFLICPKYEEYAQAIIQGRTLCEIDKKDLLSDNPIKYMGEFGSMSMRIINPETFYRLIYNN